MIAESTSPHAPILSSPTRRKAVSPSTFSDAVRTFFGFGSPRLLSLLTVGTVAVRLGLGAWSIWDSVIVLGLLAWWPFHEWLIHVLLLHLRPRKILGFTFDPAQSRAHRSHHADPTDLPQVFIPLHTYPQVLPPLFALWILLMPTAPLAWTGLTACMLLSLHYEWCHYLSHIRYTPKVKYYQRICKAHMLHHYKNEHYWFGVSMIAADTILRTSPMVKSVPSSPTCATLGIDVSTL